MIPMDQRNRKKILLIAILLTAITIHLHADDTDSENPIVQTASCNPILLSLFLSHGSGFFSLKEPQKATPYLVSNIVCIDIPLAILAGALVINLINPDFFQGSTLTATEYVVNSCCFSILISIPVIRLIECLHVQKFIKDNE